MSAGDDEHDDDAQLQQLRSVWVSMRDEEPSDRGLASLMAAAREKAAELEEAAQPSWWQRALASLRRPPVLALATVTVLLGGALFVTQREAQMKADAVVSVESAGDDYRFKGAAGSAAAGESAAAPSTTVASPMAEPAIEETAKQTEVVPEKPKTGKKASKPLPKANKSARPPDEPTPELAGPRGGGAAPGGTLQIAKDDAAPVAPPANIDEVATTGQAADTKAKKPIARTPAPPIEGADRDFATDAGPSIDQLVKQCESAAARGDCTAVRQLAKKIQTRSPAVYKSRITSNAAINRCLP